MEENIEGNIEDIEEINNDEKINETIEKISIKNKKPRTPAQIAAYTKNFEKRRLKKLNNVNIEEKKLTNIEEPSNEEVIKEPILKRNIKYQVIQYFDDSDEIPEYINNHKNIIKNSVPNKCRSDVCETKYNPLIEDYLKRKQYKFS